jgi:hypothetical protein
VYSLRTSLNVRGQVFEKVGRDLYKVKYGDNYTVLFGCQMVAQATEMGDGEGDILDSIILCAYADLQRNYVHKE